MDPDVVTGIADNGDLGGGAPLPIWVGAGKVGEQASDKSGSSDPASKCGDAHARILSGGETYRRGANRSGNCRGELEFMPPSRGDKKVTF